MEILPSVKTHGSKSPSHNPWRPIDSKRKPLFSTRSNFVDWVSFHHIKGPRLVSQSNNGEGGSIAQPCLENMPLSMELEPISSETHFDRVIAEAQQLEESLVVLWIANWCRKCIYLKPKLEKLSADYNPRKCIYLKPKLEKLAADYNSRVRFYSVDVNNVPHKLVVRAGVTKMPTIQLWRDSKKQAEVIGSHKAHLVVSEVRDMIENENRI